jgi:hypothetical protein
MFSRTNSGISSLHNFFGVDFLIYSEGGEGSQEETGELNQCPWSIDSVFWRSVFSRFLPQTKIKIKSLGSKDSVRPYAEKVSKNLIENTIVVLDRDYDPYRGETIEHPRVIYTHGYSWENDACRPEFLISVLSSIHPDGRIPEADIDEINSRYQAFLRKINRLVYIDLLCGIVKIEGVDRKNYWSMIDISNKQEPKVKRDKFIKLIASIKERRSCALRYAGTTKILPDSDCYGKILAMFYYSTFCEYYRKITNQKSIPRHFSDIKIAEALHMTDLQHYPPAIRNHYEKIMNRITT